MIMIRAGANGALLTGRDDDGGDGDDDILEVTPSGLFST